MNGGGGRGTSGVGLKDWTAAFHDDVALVVSPELAGATGATLRGQQEKNHPQL